MKPKINYDKYDFLDLGCKKGGSIGYCQKRFRKDGRLLEGLGVDIQTDHVKEVNKLGYDAIVADVLQLVIDHKFRFVSAMDFLEHLPNVTKVRMVVKKMSIWATDFIFIRHPSFDDIEYLSSLGLKITWTDCTYHKAKIKTYDFANIFNDLGLRQYCFKYKKPIWDTSDKNIIPIHAPQNTSEYTSVLGEKEIFKFKKPVYSQIDIFVALIPMDFSEWNNITGTD